MKRLFTLWVVLFVVLSAMAVPAKPGVWRTISLSDGTQVKVQLVGDEFMHYYQSADGTRYLYDAASATYQVYSDTHFSASRRKAVARRTKVNNRRAVRRKADAASIFQGTKKGLIILAQFTDSKFQSDHNLSLYKKVINGENYTDNGFTGSVKDYFKAQSAGQFELDFDVVGICQLKNQCSYYGGNDANGNDLRAGEMVAEACQWAATQGVDFSKYDWDGDGEVDQVFVLYAGKGEANGGAKSTVWPHMFYLSASDYGKSLSFNGVTVDTYACSAELNGYGKIDGIGTFCHEFSHCMGFPDLYDTGYSGWFGMGDYDLMCSGSYNGDSKCPAGYSAYEKHECGWLTYKDVTNIEKDRNVTGLKAISEGGSAYVVKNKAHEDEYYIIENRQNTGWDAYLPSEGVMITHVDYDANIWLYNTPNAQDKYYDEYNNVYYNDHQRLTIFRAGHSTSAYGDTSDLYPYNTTTVLLPSPILLPPYIIRTATAPTTCMWISRTSVWHPTEQPRSPSARQTAVVVVVGERPIPILLSPHQAQSCSTSRSISVEERVAMMISGMVKLPVVQLLQKSMTTKDGPVQAKSIQETNVYDWVPAVRLVLSRLPPLLSMVLLICHSRQEGGKELMTPHS